MGTPYKKLGKPHRALCQTYQDYGTRSRALVLEYALEFKDNGLAQPAWRPLGADPTTDVILAEKARRDYVEALKGYDVEVRIVARYVNPSWMTMISWPLVKRTCNDCGASVKVGPDLRLLPHGVLVSHIVDPLSGKVQRTSRPCTGSGAEV